MATFLAALTFTACSSDDDEITIPESGTKVNGCYIVNTGNWEGNDASIQLYSYDNNTATAGDSEGISSPCRTTPSWATLRKTFCGQKRSSLSR